jgi:NAD(P)-dependent dehydrogenase (short-subunit alcohol dehydrogenase family)
MIHALGNNLAGRCQGAWRNATGRRSPKRYTTVEEIANMVLFLCSDLASTPRGGQFVVDGRRTATGGAVTNLTAR